VLELEMHEVETENPQESASGQTDWRSWLTQRSYYDSSISFDDYRLILEFGRAMRIRFPNPDGFEQRQAELGTEWEQFRTQTGLEWVQVKSAVADSWQRGEELIADAKANKGNFDHQPTFGEDGKMTPRNLDEPNR